MTSTVVSVPLSFTGKSADLSVTSISWGEAVESRLAARPREVASKLASRRSTPWTGPSSGLSKTPRAHCVLPCFLSSSKDWSEGQTAPLLERNNSPGGQKIGSVMRRELTVLASVILPEAVSPTAGKEGWFSGTLPGPFFKLHSKESPSAPLGLSI